MPSEASLQLIWMANKPSFRKKSKRNSQLGCNNMKCTKVLPFFSRSTISTPSLSSVEVFYVGSNP